MITSLPRFGNRYCLLALLLILVFTKSFGQISCSVNAGGNSIICGSTTTLTGTTSGGPAGSPAWTFVSGPVTPTIISPNTLATDVTGMTVDGNYVFSISQSCTSGTATSQVTITAHPRPASFTAGADVTNILATVGTVNLADAVIPAGFTGTWSAYNIYSRNRFNTTVSTNSTFSNTTIANPSFSLVKKADHDIDPAYVLTLTITSLDGVCTYTDTKVVRFVPNPIIQPTLVYGSCINAPVSANSHFVEFLSTSPKFNTAIAETAGNPTYGTTVILNVVSQPPGGNISLVSIYENSRILLTGINATGDYNFTLTVTNAAGSYTTPTIKYTFTGIAPYVSIFNLASHTEQMTLYSNVGSGGEFHSSAKVGSTEPEIFYFDINPLNPNTLVTTVTQTGVIPSGGIVGTITVTGAGTANRMVTVNAPTGGWMVGTYRFTVSNQFSGGSCASLQNYYIHVSDSSRPAVNVSDFAVCYPGTGAISATVQLPAVYQGIVNSSYFQDYNGVYNFTLLSSPSGAAAPTFTSTNLRSLTSASTVIGNLDKAGDYRFRITAANLSGSSTGQFLDAEYASSGTSMTDEFVIHVENRVNANAGSDQSILCPTTVSLIGNATGASSGQWILVSSPAGSTPVFSNPTSPSTSVTGLTQEGNYEFTWQITSPLGGCVSSDNVIVNRVCGPAINIPGQVWIDADGDGVIDSGENGVANGLWANLLDPSGNVITSVQILADGSYNLEIPKSVLTISGNYSIALTNSVKAVGTQITAGDSPLNGYLYTGTNRGASSIDPTNHTGILAIGDLSTVTAGTTTNPVNFGIQSPPLADPKEFEVVNSAFSTTPPTNYPTFTGYQSIPASSPSLTGYSTGGSFSGSDPQDCSTAGTCNTSTGSTFNIGSVNTNTILYYDFGGSVGIVELTAGSIIPNFDVTKLVIYAQNGSGTGSNPIGFTYSITDKAGATSASVPYLIETNTPLPVTLISFKTHAEGQSAHLKWITATEQNSKGFGIERSNDAKNWNTIAFVNSISAAGNSIEEIEYDYIDQNPSSGTNYYRLKMIDLDKSFAYSNISTLKTDGKIKVNIYPNPVNDKIIVSGLNGDEQIVVSNANGQNLTSTKADKEQMTIDLTKYGEGIYIIQIIQNNQVNFSKKFVKIK